MGTLVGAVAIVGLLLAPTNSVASIGNRAPAALPSSSVHPLATASPSVAAVGPVSDLAVPPVGGWFTQGLQKFATPAVSSPTPLVSTPSASRFVASLVLQNHSLLPGTVVPKNLAMPLGIAYDGTNQSVIVSGAYSDSIQQLNPTNGTLLSAGTYRPLLQGPTAVATEASDVLDLPQYQEVVMASPFSGSLYVFPSGLNATGHLLGLSNGTNVSEPVALAFDSVDSRILVVDHAENVLWSVDPFNFSILGSVPAGASPVSVVYDSTTGLALVGDAGSGNITVVNPATETLVKNISSAGGPVGFARFTSGATDTIWAVSQSTGSIDVLNGATQTISSKITLPSGSSGAATALVYDPDRTEVFALNAPSGYVTVYNASDNTEVASYSIGGTPYRAVYDPARGQLDITNVAMNSLDVVDPGSGALVHRFTLGSAPIASVYVASTDIVYVADAAADWLDEVDARTDSVVGTVPLRAPAEDLFYAATPNTVVAILSDGNVSFISPGFGVQATWGPANGSLILHGTYGNGEYFFTGGQLSGAKPLHDIFILAASGFTLINTINSGVLDNGISYDSRHVNAIVASNTSLIEVNSASESVTGTIPLPAGSAASDVAYNNISNSLIVSDSVHGVYAWNMSTSTFTGSSSPGYVPGYPSRLIFEWQTRTIYASDYNSGGYVTLSESGASVTVGQTYSLTGGGPAGVAYSSLSGVSYVAFTLAGIVQLFIEDTQLTPPMFATLSLSNTAVPVGTPVSVAATATFPDWNDSFSYSGFPAECPSENNTTWVCTPVTAGAYSITLHVRNPAGVTATASVNLAVFAPLAVQSFTLNPPTFTLGYTTRIVVSFSGGVAPITVAYPQRPTGCGATSSTNWTCTPTAAGNFTLELAVTDAIGNAQYENQTVVVNPHLVIVTFGPSVSNTTVKQAVTFTADITGGTGPFTFSYTGLPPGCLTQNASTITCTPTSSGVYPVLLKVTDADGATASSQSSLVVSSPNNGNTGSNGGGLSTTDLLLILVVIIVVVAVVVVVATRRRPSSGSGPSPGPAAPVAPAPRAAPMEEAAPDEGGEAAEGEEMVFAPPPPEPMMPEAPTPSPRPVGRSEPTEAQAPVYFTDPDAAATPKSAPTAPTGGQRPSLVCSYCGTSNEPWLNTCRKCKRMLLTTGSA